MSWPQPISTELDQFEVALRRSVEGDQPRAAGPMRDLVEAGGKRLRPALVLLCQRLGTDMDAPARAAAVALELTHAATLIHDDVIDRSATRRGQPTVFAAAGPETAILVGDHGFAGAYRQAALTGRADVVEVLAATVMEICEGELEQQAARFRYSPSLDQYLRRCDLKTAGLLVAACRIGARLGLLDSDDEATCARFGRELGIAFQIVDDVLDYSSEPGELFKTVGHDLREGSATLPLMLARPNPELDELLVDGRPLSDIELERAAQVVRTSGACERALEMARMHARLAVAELAHLRDTPARAGLKELATEVVERRA